MPSDTSETQPAEPTRRGFLGWAAMLGTVALSYGLFAAYAVRFIFPASRHAQRARMFVALASRVPPGESLYFTTPEGEEYVLTHGSSPVAPFTAYSSRCPHLGCRVHWEDEGKQYICPCHGGAFDQEGRATLGPPLKAGQRLRACEVVVEGNAIYAMVERG